MTALDTLIANSLNIASVGTELYTTTTSLDSVDDEYKSTTIACSVTTALNNIQIPDSVVIVRNAQSYVESMSTEELIELEDLLNEKELSFSEDHVPKLETDIKTYVKK